MHKIAKCFSINMRKIAFFCAMAFTSPRFSTASGTFYVSPCALLAKVKKNASQVKLAGILFCPFSTASGT